jgi:hypothetical protein
MQELHEWNRRELTAERAATLILALQLHRLKHGAFPDHVSQLRGTVLERVPVDPATGGEFEFEPHGLPAPLLGAKPPALIPAQQPLLWSRLPGAALAFSAGRPGEPPAAVDAGAYMEADRVNEVSLFSFHRHAEPLHEHAIAFRTLGADGPEWLSATSPEKQ